jgi:hypothetical protein
MSVSPNSGNDLTGNRVSSESRDHTKHGEPTIEFFGSFVVSFESVLVHVLLSDVHLGFFSEEVLTVPIFGCNCHAAFFDQNNYVV